MHGPCETGETETYPSMVLMPSLYKIGCGSAPAGEQLRFSLGAFHQPLCYHPPTRDEELRLSSRWAHKIAGDEGEIDDSICLSEPDFHSNRRRRTPYASTV